MSTQEFLTAKEAAALLRMTPRAIREFLRDGKLPGRKLGNTWRIPREALARHLAGETREEESHGR